MELEQKYKEDYRRILFQDLENDYSMIYVSFDSKKDIINASVLSDCILLGFMNQEREHADLFDLFDAFLIYKELPKSEIVKTIMNVLSCGEVSHEFIRDTNGSFKKLTLKLSEDRILEIWK